MEGAHERKNRSTLCLQIDKIIAKLCGLPEMECLSWWKELHPEEETVWPGNPWKSSKQAANDIHAQCMGIPCSPVAGIIHKAGGSTNSLLFRHFPHKVHTWPIASTGKYRVSSRSYGSLWMRLNPSVPVSKCFLQEEIPHTLRLCFHLMWLLAFGLLRTY